MSTYNDLLLDEAQENEEKLQEKVAELEEEIDHLKKALIQARGFSLSWLQNSLKFTMLYSAEFGQNPLPHKVFSHALTHVGKALGRLFGLSDDLDHDPSPLYTRNSAVGDPYKKYLADVVICAARAAQEFPGGKFDLGEEIIRRADEKGML